MNNIEQCMNNEQSFKVISKTLIVTDPKYGIRKKGSCQVKLDNVLNGKYINHSENEYQFIVVHEDYKEDELKWINAKYPVEIDSGLLGVYDLCEYENYYDASLFLGLGFDNLKCGMTLYLGSDFLY